MRAGRANPDHAEGEILYDGPPLWKLSWGQRWAIAGIHSYNWGWVRRFGAMPCGCTRNPVTRRIVCYLVDCGGDHRRTVS